MKPHTFHAMGTEWSLVAANADDLLRDAEGLVRWLELRLSRFNPDSALSALNRDRRSADPLLGQLVRVALTWRTRTLGLLDPTLGGTLASLGYARSFEEVDGRPSAPVDARPSVTLEGEEILLHGDGELDLGGIAKGWAVDQVARRLVLRGVRYALVDGGGDLRAIGGPWSVGVGDDDAIVLRGDAVATSSTLRRAWRAADGTPMHHVLDPRTGRPSVSAITTSVVRASDATTADALATALLIDPEKILPLLPSFGASARVADAEGVWWTTTDWEQAA